MLQEHKNAINMGFPSFFSPFVAGRAWPARIYLCQFDLIPFITVHTEKPQIKGVFYSTPACNTGRNDKHSAGFSNTVNTSTRLLKKNR